MKADFPLLLVTGATGFIGRRLLARLEMEGKGRVQCLPHAQLNRPGTSAPDFEWLLHLAAATSVPESWKDPSAYLESNTLLTQKLLEWCRIRGAGMTYISTFVYAPKAELPYRETDPVLPPNPYALSKHLAEEICRFYRRSYDIPVCIVRPSNIYGPGQPTSFLPASVIAQLLDSSKTELILGNLAPTRDFVFVDDVVDGLLRSIGKNVDHAIHLASGKSITVGEFVECAIKALAIRKPICSSGVVRTSDIMDVAYDISSARELLDWEATTDLISGIRRTAQEKLSCKN
jgi:GDP-4-dehydro-6-deoxy-D-mannose reductase